MNFDRKHDDAKASVTTWLQEQIGKAISKQQVAQVIGYKVDSPGFRTVWQWLVDRPHAGVVLRPTYTGRWNVLKHAEAAFDTYRQRRIKNQQLRRVAEVSVAVKNINEIPMEERQRAIQLAEREQESLREAQRRLKQLSNKVGDLL